MAILIKVLETELCSTKWDSLSQGQFARGQSDINPLSFSMDSDSETFWMSMNHNGHLPGSILGYLYFWHSRVETGQRDNSFLLCLAILLRLFAFLALVLPKIRDKYVYNHPRKHFLFKII